ncbi:phosphonoacetaldehyde hydrolase [Halomonas sp. DP5N14-9]|uniref:phosphonoacetaldehyde hydrolase n=1 Tax=Halomonas sp. DP5N14-9 TaxID=2859075 RepID=UPI001C994658|nr:phosphonoacetaldehyde hydrolase [Halomonas sp. DP5N14-9]MBY5943524.1 phosphonoacetaldehyde hydrolase [Halomonas sp. DP5N14-9]
MSTDHHAPLALEAVIFDWAGTLVDFGSFAPTQVFVEVFAEIGVAVSLDEARGPMGMSKWDHIRALCDLPDIAERFRRACGHSPSDEDVDVLYRRFMPLQVAKVAEHSAPIPGARECLAGLRGRGLKIGSCSGYPAEVLAPVRRAARQAGLEVDHAVAGDEVVRGRPGPAQALANVVALGIGDVAACVKVDDTAPGIEEGRAAGMWTVAVTDTGNAMGLDLEGYQATPPDALERRRRHVAERLSACRPHYLIASVAELDGVLDQIAARLARGERPQAL